MLKNRVQFQRGMSLPEFVEQYGTQSQCERALFAWRWLRGFVCPECGGSSACVRITAKLDTDSRPTWIVEPLAKVGRIFLTAPQ
jgi:hypothetical protein